MATKFSFTVNKKIGVIKNYPLGWKREINLISDNDGKLKYDIRDWDSDHICVGRGISLEHDEAVILKKIFNEIEEL